MEKKKNMSDGSLKIAQCHKILSLAVKQQAQNELMHNLVQVCDSVERLLVVAASLRTQLRFIYK